MGGDETHECPTCGDTFASENGVKIHHKQIHGESLAGVEKVCEHCGEKYNVLPSRDGESRFCSSSCAGKWHGERRKRNTTTLICDNCGEEYEVYPSETDNSSFCSKECMAEGLSNKETQMCEWCGQEYEVQPARADESRFCSHQCMSEYGASVKKDHSATLTCEVCGQEYEVRPARADESRFCSQECYGQWVQERVVEESHPRWRGGPAPYGSGWSERKKRKVRIRDQARCQVCGMSEREHYAEYGWALEVHHITPARNVADESERNAMDNLITLCRECHGDVEEMAPLLPDGVGSPAD